MASLGIPQDIFDSLTPEGKVQYLNAERQRQMEHAKAERQQNAQARKEERFLQYRLQTSQTMVVGENINTQITAGALFPNAQRVVPSMSPEQFMSMYH